MFFNPEGDKPEQIYFLSLHKAIFPTISGSQCFYHRGGHDLSKKWMDNWFALMLTKRSSHALYCSLKWYKTENFKENLAKIFKSFQILFNPNNKDSSEKCVLLHFKMIISFEQISCLYQAVFIFFLDKRLNSRVKKNDRKIREQCLKGLDGIRIFDRALLLFSVIVFCLNGK